jgi:hypothetical protein
VGERVAHEGKPPQHDEHPDRAGQHAEDHHRQQRPLHKGDLEGLDQQTTHGVVRITLSP